MGSMTDVFTFLEILHVLFTVLCKTKMGDTQNCTQIVNLKNQIKCLKERLIKKNEELERAKRLIKNLKIETESLKQVSSSGAEWSRIVRKNYKHFPFNSV